MPTVTCTGCTAIKPKWKQWYRCADGVRCPKCAPASMREERRAKKRKLAGQRPPQPNKHEDADRAARCVLTEGVTRKDAMARFRIGRTTLLAAIGRARGPRSAP